MIFRQFFDGADAVDGRITDGAQAGNCQLAFIPYYNVRRVLPCPARGAAFETEKFIRLAFVFAPGLFICQIFRKVAAVNHEGLALVNQGQAVLDPAQDGVLVQAIQLRDFLNAVGLSGAHPARVVCALFRLPFPFYQIIAFCNPRRLRL